MRNKIIPNSWYTSGSLILKNYKIILVFYLLLRTIFETLRKLDIFKVNFYLLLDNITILF